MTSPKDRTPSDVVADRIRQVRRRQDITAAMLAVRCAELGRPDLTASVISNIESGRRDRRTGRRRRDVTVDELLVLAAALSVAPVHLLVPPHDDSPYPVTPERPEPAGEVREWVRGFVLLPTDDRQVALSEAPQEDYYVEDGVLFPTWTRAERHADG